MNKYFEISIIFFVSALYYVASAERSFQIDHTHNTFVRDGKPFRYISGDFAYFKVPAAQWKDRLTKYKQLGLNAVQTYISWMHHEPEKGKYNFTGDNDFVHFIKLAQELDMVVILRAGPFINAELDMGGLPYWLLSINKNMKMRTLDIEYMAEVEIWLSVLLPKVKPLLYHNGGPVIMVQPENEYGFFWHACDRVYLARLRDWFRHYLGNEILLFTTDNLSASNLKCAPIDGVFMTVDFGTHENPKETFTKFRQYQKTGPSVNSEFYPGWINKWEFPYEHITTEAVVKSLDEILSLNASVNIYPVGGGTLFAFTSGSKGEPMGPTEVETFEPVVTSYEFDGPLTEAGDPTDKYFAIRKVIGKYTTLPPTVPTVAPKMEVKNVMMKPVADIYTEMYSDIIVAEDPLTFSDARVGGGFILYSHTLTETPESTNLTIDRIGDRGLVFVDKKYEGLLSSTHKKYSINLKNAKKGSQIDILVENQGGYAFIDVFRLKGILYGVTLGKTTLKNWTHKLLFRDWYKTVSTIEKESSHLTVKSEGNIPKFFTGTFKLADNITEPLDSFISFEGWGKGQAFLNGFNLGRYWPLAGPQQTLYAPKNLFRAHPMENRITVFELERNPCAESSKCVVNFVKVHNLNGKVARDNGDN